MITSLSIENFKGIGDRITIPIRPITLLFGPNSAGKSTIMHAIHYAREVLERHNLDADTTVAGGDCVNLGGFSEMVHRKERHRRITLRFELDLSGVAWHEEFPVDEFVHEDRVGSGYSDLSAMGLDVMSGWVEVTVGYRDPDHDSRPVVLKYSVGLDGEHLASLVQVPYELTSDGVDRGAVLADLNLYHPALVWDGPDAESLGPVDSSFPSFRGLADALYFSDQDVQEVSDKELHDLAAGKQKVRVLRSPEEFNRGTMRRIEQDADKETLTIWVGKCRETRRLEVCAVSSPSLSETAEAEEVLEYLKSAIGHRRAPEKVVLGARDALPWFDRPLRLELEEEDNDLYESSESSSYDEPDPRDFVQQLLSRLVVGPGRFLRDSLARFRYVGPIREVPPPEHLPPRYPDPSRWASGLAGWDLLANPNNGELVKSVSAWLWRDDCLDTGCQLVAKHVREIEQHLQERMLRVEWEEGEPSDLAKDILAELDRLPKRQRVYVRDVEKGVDLPACSVGLGISQVVPVIVSLLADDADVVQVEQPALHLHPTQQAAVGDLLIEAALGKSRKVVLVETHSEHLILRILRRIRQTKQGYPFKGIAVRPQHVITLYVEPKDGQTSPFEIAIGEDGEFLQPWPDKFFDQDYEERFG